MSMDSFKVFLEARGISYKMTPEILGKDYYPKFKHYPNQRFSEVLEWLKDNHNINRFPSPKEFYEAYTYTAKPKYVNDEKPIKEEPIDHEAYSKTILKFAEQFKTQEVKDKEKNKHRARKMYEKAKADGRVWSYRLHKWVDRTLMNNIGGEFKLPEDVLY